MRHKAFISLEITSALITVPKIACDQLVAMKEPPARTELVIKE